MQALLPYLKQIAEALISRNKEGDKKGNEALSSIEKTISVSTAKQTSAAAEGNANTSAIGATLEKGLLLTVEEEQGGETVQVVKSVFQILMDSILAKMEDALFVTVTENGQQVTKGIAQLLKEQNESISRIKDALYDSTTTPATTVLTKLDEIADAIGSGVDAQTIADGIDQSSALQAIHGVLATDTNNIQSDVHTIATETNVIREALHNPNNANDTIFDRVQGIGNDTDVIRGEVTQINNKIQ